MPENDDMVSTRTVMILSVVVMAVVSIMVTFVVEKAKQKPQSPQAMVAAAIREWKPGMGPQPFMYHPAAQTSPSWRPLPQTAGPQSIATVPAQQPQQQTAAGWAPLPGAGAQPIVAPQYQTQPQGFAQGQQPIRAYRGPVQ